jgi:hypothetical protein
MRAAPGEAIFCCLGTSDEPPCSSSEVAQYKAGAPRTANAVAEIVGGGPRVGANSNLVKRAGAA